MTIKSLQEGRGQPKAGLTQINDLCRGSRTAGRRKCGHPYCDPLPGPCNGVDQGSGRRYRRLLRRRARVRVL